MPRNESTYSAPSTAFHLTVLSLFVLGVFLSASPWESWLGFVPYLGLRDLLAKILQAVGEALVVAQVIIVTVDQAAKAKLLQEFAKDVSGHIIGKHLPVELRVHIMKLLEAPFVRTKWEIIYTISTWPGQSEYWRLVTESGYEIENVSDTEQKFLFFYSLEESFAPHIGRSQITRLKAEASTSHKIFFDYPQDGVVPVEFRDNYYRVEREVSISPGTHCEFTSEAEQCFRIDSTLPFVARYPVLSTNLVVNYPTDKLDVFLELSSGSPDEDTVCLKREIGKRWAFKKPLLPGQSFVLRVSKK